MELQGSPKPLINLHLLSYFYQILSMYLVESRSALNASFDLILILLHTVDTFRLMLQKRKLSLTDEKSCFSDGKLKKTKKHNAIRILTTVC